MKWLVLAIALLLAMPASAQMTMMSVENQRAAGGGGYSGPGNVVSGATVFWGLRAYNATYATGLGKLALICTPADAVCANVNSDASGNFNLAGTPSLTCNNSGSICTVKTLFDQIGTNCTGACDVTNSTIANRPILVVPGAANGCSTTSNFCIKTTGGTTQVLVAIAGLGSAVNQVYSLVFAYENTGSGTETLLYANVTVPQVSPGFGGANALLCSAGVSNGVTASDNVYHAVHCIMNNTISNVVVDVTQNTPIALGANGTFTAIFYLFNDAATTNTHSFGGFFLELGLWPADLTSTRGAMNTNIHTYWGF